MWPSSRSPKRSRLLFAPTPNADAFSLMLVTPEGFGSRVTMLTYVFPEKKWKGICLA